MATQVTEGIEVRAEPYYVAEESRPEQNYYFFAYKITLTNRGSNPAKLLNRHWIITDGWGETQEVRGPGVVGKQPYLKPGDSFEYTSYCPLHTPAGKMKGSYEFLRDDQSTFEASIPEFELIPDDAAPVIH